MDVHLTTDAADRGAVRLHVNGALVAELAAGVVHGAAALQAEVQAARGLQALAQVVQQWQTQLAQVRDRPDPAARQPVARQWAFARGLEEGLVGHTLPHPRPGVPPLQPETGASYAWGYEHGEALRRCLALVAAARDGGGER